MTLLRVVVGNARAEVVDVVKANVAREPLQQFGQFVEGTALKENTGSLRPAVRRWRPLSRPKELLMSVPAGALPCFTLSLSLAT